MQEGLNIFGGFAGIGVLAVCIGFAYTQFRSGANKAKDDLVETLKESLEVEKDKVKMLTEEKNTLIVSYQQQLNVMNEKIGKLQGLYEASEKRNKEYLEILQGRSPEQTQFMQLMTTTSRDATIYMRDTSAILQDIKKFMGSMNNAIAQDNLFKKTLPV